MESFWVHPLVILIWWVWDGEAGISMGLGESYYEEFENPALGTTKCMPDVC